jgi:hypothetical protein
MILRMAIWVLLCGSAVADELRFESGAKQNSLIELYTSEGCSSCPPAEAWLSKLKSDSKLWKEFVPLAFHVDYWDRLGWRDRFASRDSTQRQYNYASLLRQESVYTPEFILNGQEWRDGFGDRRLTNANTNAAGTLSAKTTDNKTFSISYQNQDRSNFEAHVALLGCGIASKIGAGENGGRELQHDFVVLDHQSQIMQNDSRTWRASLKFDSANNHVPQTAIAIWITHEKQLVPVQATGGWLGKIASPKQH